MKHFRILLISLLVAIAGCVSTGPNSPIAPKKGNLAIIYLLDSSQSSQKPLFEEQINAVCESLKSNIHRGDMFTQIFVAGDSYPYTSPTEVSPKVLREKCGKRTISEKKGTFTDQAFDQALKAMNDGDNIPLLLIHVQANESETDPVAKWRQTIEKAISEGGSVLVIGSTNDGNEAFNFKLVKAFEGLPRVVFVSAPTDIKHSIAQSIKR